MATTTANYSCSLRTAVPRMTREEQVDHARRYKAGDKRAGQRLVESVLPLARKIATEYRTSRTHLDDLVQQANLGACRALDKYDPDKGVLFSTYATLWMRAMLLSYLMTSHSLVKIGTNASEREAYWDIVKRDGARSAGDGVDKMRGRMVPDKHLDTLTDRARVFRDGAANAEDILDVLERRERARSFVDEWVKSFDQRERVIYRKRWRSDEPASLKALADEFGITRERARQLEERMLDRLREMMPAALAT